MSIHGSDGDAPAATPYEKVRRSLETERENLVLALELWRKQEITDAQLAKGGRREPH